MDLNLVHLVFSLTFDGAVATPCELFDLFSRRFPAAFRSSTCGQSAPCTECPDTEGCSWFPLFGQQLSTDPEAVRRHQKPPLPFVFDFPILAPGAGTASDLEIGLVLAGSAVNHAGSFIRALEQACAAGPAGSQLSLSLDGVSSQGLFGERSPLWATKRGELRGDLRVLSAVDISEQSLPDHGDLTLTFLTPFRQVREGHLLRSFDCSAFLRGLMRRISALAATYGGGELDADFRLLTEVSRGIEVQQSSLTVAPATGPKTAGLQGSVCLTGELAPFLPFLLLGEYLHAGKGAAWGFGRYEVGDQEPGTRNRLRKGREWESGLGTQRPVLGTRDWGPGDAGASVRNS